MATVFRGGQSSAQKARVANQLYPGINPRSGHGLYVAKAFTPEQRRIIDTEYTRLFPDHDLHQGNRIAGQKFHIAKRLYPGVNPKSAQGRYVRSAFTEEQQNAVDAEFVKLTSPSLVRFIEEVVVNPFDFDTWRKGTPRPDAKKLDRVIINTVKDRTDARENALFELLKVFVPTRWADTTIEDHRTGIQTGADFAVVKDDTVIAMIDSKSGPYLTRFQRERALQCDKAGVEYWIVDPENKKTMQITSACTFVATQYRVYPPEQTNGSQDS